MKKLKTFFSMICILAIVLADPYVAFAETEQAETAAKTVKVSTKENEEGDVEDPEKEKDGGVEDKLQEMMEDGVSERSKAAPVERMDITEMTEVHVGNYEEWVKFAKSCSLNTWSDDKYVVITDDIDFNMKEFVPIPYFAGVLEGGGHTLNKAAFTGNQNYIGIFSKTAPTAVIRNLNVIGVMKPEGQPFNVGGIVGDNSGMIANSKFEGYVEGYDYIGGIAGYNTATGTISQCIVTGDVIGLHHVGGICGGSSGLVTACSTKASINTVTKEAETGIKDIKVEEVFTSLINKGKEENQKKSILSSDSPVDIGGIVGHNTGEISSCVNESNVGYEHVGYNIGGIAGRQSGYVHDCGNQGFIKGRKDAGGIVGQAEPFMKLDLNADIIAQVSTAINKLHDSVDQTIKDTDASSDVVSARLNVIKGFADRALGDTGYLANSTQDYVNGVAGAANEVIGRVEYAVSETSKKDGPMDDIAEAGAHLRDTAKDLESAVKHLDLDDYIEGAEQDQYDDAVQKLEERSEYYNSVYEPKFDEKYNEQYPLNYYRELTGNNWPGPGAVPSEADLKNAEESHVPPYTAEEIAQKKAKASEDATNTASAYAEAEADAAYLAKYHTSYSTDMAAYTKTIADTFLAHAPEMLEDASDDGKKAIKDAEKMADDLKDAGKGMRNILRDISEKGPVRIPQLSEEYRLHTNSLVANIQGMSDNLGFLNNEMKGSTDIMCKDLEGVNDDFASLLILITDAMDGALDMDYSDVFEDESDDVCETSVDATIAKCTNTGEIYSDIDTGGIAGTMAQEYDFDLESDLTGVKSAAKKSTFRTKCVIRDSVNRGQVRGKKSYAGGICGLHEIGTIIRGQNYAKVSSESGDYVGGITGRSYSSIRDSREKGVLSGQSYIGGITGSAEDVSGCIAMPTIISGTNFCGAIAGSADESGKLTDNIFVSDSLAGVDRVSLAGSAYPVTYGELMVMDNIPADYRKLKIDFIVDNKIVATVFKDSGEVITPAETPIEAEIAKRGGRKQKKQEIGNDDKIILEEDEYINWDCDEEIPVYEDMEINGEITRFTSTLASELKGERAQSKFLVDGKFIEGDKLIIKPSPSNNADVEEYHIVIPDDGLLTHRIRYEIPGDSVEERIFVKTGGEYVEAQIDMYGQYQVFDMSGNEVDIRIDKRDVYKILRTVGKYAAMVGGVIALLILIKVIIWRRRKKRQKLAEAANADGIDIVDLSEDAPDAAPEENAGETKEKS